MVNRMQIVIDIDDKVYGILKYFEKALGLNIKKDDNGSDDVKTALMRAVINGIPLPKGHWIPVSERLPEEKYKNYLVYCNDGYIATIMYDGKRWLIDDAEIVAWMPLPQPYRGEVGETE